MSAQKKEYLARKAAEEKRKQEEKAKENAAKVFAPDQKAPNLPPELTDSASIKLPDEALPLATHQPANNPA